MDAIRVIKDDHFHVRGLFDELEAAKDTGEQQALATQIIEELSVHATVEEQLLYPLLRDLVHESEEDVLNALEEHHVAKLILVELDRMDADHERFKAKVHVLRENIESHIEEEELELLPKLEKELSADQLEALGQAIVAMKEAAPNHPHPLAPDTPPGNLVAAVFAKLGDAGKDLLRRLTGSRKAEGHRRVKQRAQAVKKQAAQRKPKTTARNSKPPRKAAKGR